MNVTEGESASQLVAALVGPGITVVPGSETYTGAADASGLFTSGGTLGIDHGVVLTDGSASGAAGPNNATDYSVENNVPGDTQLTALAGQTTYDASVLSFSFTTQSGNLFFNYVFGSEEYPEYVNQYNDVFAFYLDGANIALLPGTTTPVSINTVNASTNSAYFRNNNFQDGTAPYNTQYDGLTTVLTASMTGLSAGTHTIKLAIADSNDSDLDSGVFLQSGTFSSQAAAPSFSIAATSADKPDGTSGTTPYTFTVTRTGDTSGNAQLFYFVGGSGSNPAPSSMFVNSSGTVTFNAGDTTQTITVNVNGATVTSPEDFTVSITAEGQNITNGNANGVIEPNPVTPVYSIAAASADKADGTSGTTPYTFTVSRTGSTTGGQTLYYSVAGSGSHPAPTSQFANPTGNVTFNPGDSAETVTINVNGGQITQAEGFSVTIAGANVTVSQPTASGTIEPNYTPPTEGSPIYAISATSADKADGTSGTTPYTFTVTRTGSTVSSGTVGYTVSGSGNNPAPGYLFANPSGSVFFNAGDTSQVITVNVNGAQVSAPEGFTVGITSYGGGTVTQGSAFGTIEPNYQPPVYAISATNADKADGLSGTTPYTFTVARTGDNTGSASLSYTVTGSGNNPAPFAMFSTLR